MISYGNLSKLFKKYNKLNLHDNYQDIRLNKSNQTQ